MKNTPKTCDLCENYLDLLESSELLSNISHKYFHMTKAQFWRELDLQYALELKAKKRIAISNSKCYLDIAFEWKRFIIDVFQRFNNEFEYLYGITLQSEDHTPIKHEPSISSTAHKNKTTHTISYMTPNDFESFNGGIFTQSLQFRKGESFSAVFGEIIKNSNKKNAQFATECNIDPRTISRIFNDRERPSRSHLYRLCLALHMSPFEAMRAFYRCEGIDPLSSCSIPDIALLYFLEHKHYNIDDYIDDCWNAFEAFQVKPPTHFPKSLGK